MSEDKVKTPWYAQKTIVVIFVVTLGCVYIEVKPRINLVSLPDLVVPGPARIGMVQLVYTAVHSKSYHAVPWLVGSVNRE